MSKARGKRCEAMTAKGERCQRGVMRAGDGRFCVAHGRGNRRPAGRQRCTARTKSGAQCKQWALRRTVGRRSQPRCVVHNRWGKRCTATTALGKPCRRRASQGSRRRYGKWLCVRHEPGYVFPQPPEGRRCEARTLAGARCKRWARATGDGARVLCVAHDVERGHPNLRHGYYRKLPFLGPAEVGMLQQLRAEEGPLAATIYLLRLRTLDMVAYVTDDELPLAKRMPACELALRLVRATHALVMLAQEEGMSDGL